ncbi:MAG: hypothetical protein HQ518_32795 [Rhodopirellula sp.]|nr:hypothetical protein [Rhodopirellula sp.]
MAGTTQDPYRIQPFYETPEPGKELQLLKKDSAPLKQDDPEIKGTVQITQKWSVTTECCSNRSGHREFRFDEDEIESRQRIVFSRPSRRSSAPAVSRNGTLGDTA